VYCISALRTLLELVLDTMEAVIILALILLLALIHQALIHQALIHQDVHQVMEQAMDQRQPVTRLGFGQVLGLEDYWDTYFDLDNILEVTTLVTTLVTLEEEEDMPHQHIGVVDRVCLLDLRQVHLELHLLLPRPEEDRNGVYSIYSVQTKY